jgi:hypothetical protein
VKVVWPRFKKGITRRLQEHQDARDSVVKILIAFENTVICKKEAYFDTYHIRDRVLSCIVIAVNVRSDYSCSRD